ncbi:MAG: hypothetical protein K2M59_07775 [Muribaculaceae bacterium]|nr:hypothetical protein [Muribaculaceae bacterium]
MKKREMKVKTRVNLKIIHFGNSYISHKKYYVYTRLLPSARRESLVSGGAIIGEVGMMK